MLPSARTPARGLPSRKDRGRHDVAAHAAHAIHRRRTRRAGPGRAAVLRRHLAPEPVAAAADASRACATFGALLAGSIAQVWGAPGAFLVGGVVGLAAVAAVLGWRAAAGTGEMVSGG